MEKKPTIYNIKFTRKKISLFDNIHSEKRKVWKFQSVSQ